MRVSVIGATGYGGVELVRILHQHPKVDEIICYSHSHGGMTLQEVFPHLTNLRHLPLQEVNINQIAEQSDIVFTATPAGVSHQIIPSLQKWGVPCIDLSGDLRFPSPEVYEKWYGKKTASASFLQKVVYGLPEWFSSQIAEAQVIANPGCYPTAASLGLLPLLSGDVIIENSILVDAKSGVSGAGRSLSLGTHYGEVNESVAAYKIGVHQHTPEIEENIKRVTNKEVAITFTPHLVPMTRGILCTIYASLKGNQTIDEIEALFRDRYRNKPFVRLRPRGIYPKTKEVVGSNYCDIGIQVDTRTNRVVVISVIDNVMKGAAGQAVQNWNIMSGWAEDTGLTFTPLYP